MIVQRINLMVHVKALWKVQSIIQMQSLMLLNEERK
jgi:hypothetical protein